MSRGARRTLEDFADQVGGFADDLRAHFAEWRTALTPEALDQLRALARQLDDASSEILDLATGDDAFTDGAA